MSHLPKETSNRASDTATVSGSSIAACASRETFTKEYLAKCCPEEVALIVAIKNYWIAKAERAQEVAEGRLKESETKLEQRDEYIKDTLEFEWEIYGQLVNSEFREKHWKAQLEKQSKELHDLTLTTDQLKKKSDETILENFDLKKAHEMANKELKKQLDTKDAKLREFEEELKQQKEVNEQLQKEIENTRRAAEENARQDTEPEEDEMEVDTQPLIEILSSEEDEQLDGLASDANDEDYKPDEAFSRKTAGLSRIKKEAGVRTRNQQRETEGPMEISAETALLKMETVMENACKPQAAKSRTVRKEPYPQRLCSNPIAAINECQNLRDPRMGAVIPFTVPHPPEFQKRSTTKRKLMSRSGSGSAAIGDPDDVDDEGARSNRRSAKKGWQASVK